MVNYLLSFAAGLLLAAIIAWHLNRIRVKRFRRHQHSLLLRARSAEKMAHIGNLVGNLAHEIRNPLSIIKVNLQLLCEDISYMLKNAQPGDELGFGKTDNLAGKLNRQLRKLETISSETDRLADTLSDFMNYAGRMELHPADHDINELLDELIDFYEPQAIAHSVRIRRSLLKGPAVCRIDADHVKQAFLNLFINATQAMDQGGELMIRSSIRTDNVSIEITDTGPGIPLDQQDKIFDPYYTTRPGGTGLGLPICRRIFEEHNGQIVLHSEPDKGTCFSIELPLIKE